MLLPRLYNICASILYTGFLYLSLSEHFKLTLFTYKACANHPTYHPRILLITLLKAKPLFNQHQLDSMLFLVNFLSLAGVHSQLLVPPPPGTLPSHVGSSPTETVFHRKLTSSSLFMILNIFPGFNIMHSGTL